MINTQPGRRSSRFWPGLSPTSGRAFHVAIPTSTRKRCWHNTTLESSRITWDMASGCFHMRPRTLTRIGMITSTQATRSPRNPVLYGPELRGGIRLEQNYRVTTDGVERLTTFPLDLV